MGKVKCLYQEQWLIAYEENDYPSDYTLKPGGRSKPVKVTDLNTNEVSMYASFTEAGEHLGVNRKLVSEIANGKHKGLSRYLVEIL